MRSGREPARFLKLEITMLGSGFILVGAAMFAIWLFLRKKAKATGQWPSTRGRVVASDVYLNRSTEGPGMEEVRGTYDYAVAGATLRGNRISMGGSGSGGIKAQFARYQVQLLGGAAMFYRSVVEMQTGEGKTLVATLPMYLHALLGKGCH